MKRSKVVFTSASKVEFHEDLFEDKIESPHEIIIKNMYSMVSAGTELACLSGAESWFLLPGTPGYLSVGEVIEKGSEVDHLETGDVVYAFGPHASVFKIDTSCRWGGMNIKVPGGLRQDMAPFARMASIAITGLRMSSIELGDYVAVAGLGTIGNFAAQQAQLQGANVICFDVSDKRIELAKQCGLDNAFNSYGKDIVEEIKSRTGGRGVNTLIDATGNAALIESMMSAVSLYGEVILVGSPRAPYQTDLTKILQDVHLNTGPNSSVTIKGALEYRYPTFEQEFVKHSITRNTKIIFDLMMSGKLKVEPLFTHCVTPDKAPEVYKGLQEEKDTYIGVVFDWTGI
jgi:2-desacetyl-2-hydroxyethyl bacteriochlorophyllide A dehydrogenase